MTSSARRSAPRAGLALAGVLLVVAGVAAMTPVVPRVSAVDPTPDPSASVSPDPGPTPTAEPDPTPAPTPDPTPDPTPAPTPDPTTPPDASPEPSPGDGGSSPEPSASPSEEPSPAPSATPEPTPPTGIEVTHSWVDELDASGDVVDRGAADDGLARMERFTVYLVRFEVVNTGDTPVELSPHLEAGLGASPGSWGIVPQADPVPGNPFYAASDDGRVFRVRSSAIAPSALRRQDGPAPDYRSVPGMSSAGRNPAPTITLPPKTFTEVEFAVRATVDAAWRQDYAFRLRPAVETVAAGAPVVVTMRSKPPIVLTVPPSTTAVADPSPRYQLAMAAGPTTGPTYRLAASVDATSPHISSSLDSDGCASCHSAHRASSTPLLSNVYRVDPLRSATEPYDGADFGLCLTCHQESPYADLSGSSNPLTNFAGHGFHLGHIEENGTGGVDIGIPGDGQGNALCAECHYNLHGVPTSERGLVRFAPDVEPFAGQIRFDATTGSCTLTCHGKSHDGLTFEVSQVSGLDSVAPTTTAPSAVMRSGASLSGSSVPLLLTWTGSDNAGGSGIDHYELARTTDGGATWPTVSSSLATTSAAVTAAASGTVRYRVRAVDEAGNAGDWAYGPTIRPRMVQQSSAAVAYGGTWTTVKSSSYSGGSARYAKVNGRWATYRFTGRTIALITTKAPNRGKVKIYINGVRVATVDLYRSSSRYRVLAWQKTWSTSGTRTIKVVVVGTSGRPRVDVDAFVVVK